MKSVGINEYTHRELQKIAKVYGVDMGKFIAQSVDYFKSTGINPTDREVGYSTELKRIKKEMKNLANLQNTIDSSIIEKLQKELSKYLPKDDDAEIASKELISQMSLIWKDRHEYMNSKIDSLGEEINGFENAILKQLSDISQNIRVILDHGAGTYIERKGGHKTSIIESYNKEK